MRILIVAATSLEIGGLFGERGKLPHEVDFLIAGIGQTRMAINLTKFLITAPHAYDLALNAGVAGSLDYDLPLGSVYEIVSDCFADFGIQTSDRFIKITETDFFRDKILGAQGTIENHCPLLDLPEATALTSNIVHGEAASIAELKRNFPYQLESMEGAAFFYTCRSLEQPCAQIRAISNYVEARDRNKWRMELATENLVQALEDSLEKITPT